MQTMQEYKCPCCGGAIEFDSTLQKMKCPYCDTEFDVESLAAYDEQLKSDEADDMQWEDAKGGEWHDGEEDSFRTYICNSCGGEIIGDDTTAATSCPFCGNPVVMMGQLSGALKPDYVIPFKLDKKAAKEGLLKHLSGKHLLPKVFKDQNHIDEIKGVYVPFWLFDTDVSAKVRYRAQKVRFWSDRNYNYTETRYYSLHRAGMIGFENVPVDGSSKLADDLMESIEPYDFSEAVDFQTAYLAGYFADKYDVGSDVGIVRANERVKRSTEDEFARTVHGYSSVTTENSSLKLTNAKAKYALYPVWLLNTTWNGQNYIFAMNGQTGKFVGDLPVDRKAAFKWTVGLTAVFSAAVFLGSLLLYYLGML